MRVWCKQGPLVWRVFIEYPIEKGRSRLVDEKTVRTRALRQRDRKSVGGKLCAGHRRMSGFVFDDVALEAKAKKKNVDSVVDRFQKW